MVPRVLGLETQPLSCRVPLDSSPVTLSQREAQETREAFQKCNWYHRGKSEFDSHDTCFSMPEMSLTAVSALPYKYAGSSKMPKWYRIKKWRKEMRERILKRDHYTCQTCGYSPLRILVGKPMLLHIHHIDKDRKNNNDNNQITLCHSCHSKLHYKEQYH